MFDDATALVAEYDRRVLASDDEDSDQLELPSAETSGKPENLTADRAHRGYQLMAHWIPSLARKIQDLEPQEVTVLYRNVRKGADAARADDCSVLKKKVVSWISDMYPDAARLDEDIKRGRGIESDATGPLLCPAEWDWGDEEIVARIRDGDPQYQLTADHWSSFLYAKYRCDPTDLEKGLFKSTFLLKAFKCLFTSPASAKDVVSEDENEEPAQPPRKKRKGVKRSSTRGSVAQILGVKEVTGRMIAYVAVQVHFALEDISSWSNDIERFNYITFYNNIVDYFEYTPGPTAQAHVKELLKWWNMRVFGSSIRVDDGSAADPNASVSRMMAQRSAKEQGRSG